MIEHKYPLDVRPEDLAPWLAPADVQQVTPMPGWHNSIFRVDVVDGTRFVLRVNVPEEPAEYVEPTLRIAGAYSSRLKFVPAPIQTRSNELWSPIDGRVASLWPFLEGEVRRELTVNHRNSAARVLAEIHTAGTRFLQDGGFPTTWSLRGMGWRGNRRWSLSRVVGFLSSTDVKKPGWVDQAALISELEASANDVSPRLASMEEQVYSISAVHGDFYPGNLLFDAGDEIVAVLDWDDARVDWTGWDVGTALLEFCAGPAGIDLDATQCSSFIAEYRRAGGALTEDGRSQLPTLIRGRKLDDVMYTLDEMARSVHADWEWCRISLDAWRQVQDLERV